jgi:hypothetical protein
VSHPLFHAQSSARLFGGRAEDYTAVHEHLDATKEVFADFRHRAIRHHSQGIYDLEREFEQRAIVEAARKLLDVAQNTELAPEMAKAVQQMKDAIGCHYIVNSVGTKVPVRYVGEQHIREDCGGTIPSVADWFRNMTPAHWMSRGYTIRADNPSARSVRETAPAVDGQH